MGHLTEQKRATNKIAATKPPGQEVEGDMQASIPSAGRQVPAIENVTPDVFAALRAQGKPAVFKGLARHWTLVEQAKLSDQAAVEYLKGCDNGRPTEVWLGDPAIKGEFFFGHTLDELNFHRFSASLSPTLDHLCDLKGQENPPALFIQSMSVADHLPSLLPPDAMSLLPGVSPRIWIGNRTRVQTHYDPVENIACLAAGRRRFTLFAPDQLKNLYIGPLYKTIAGAPTSLASLENPDFERFPRLREALANAWYADLEPGDALYIPYFWWHHVQSLTPFNILVNYWWDDAAGEHADAMDAFINALLSVRSLSSGKRAIWANMFAHYVLETDGDAAAHIDVSDRGILGPLSDEEASTMKQQLLARLIARWKA